MSTPAKPAGQPEKPAAAATPAQPAPKVGDALKIGNRTFTVSAKQSPSTESPEMAEWRSALELSYNNGGIWFDLPCENQEDVKQTKIMITKASADAKGADGKRVGVRFAVDGNVLRFVGRLKRGETA